LVETADLPFAVVAERSGHGSDTALAPTWKRDADQPHRYRTASGHHWQTHDIDVHHMWAAAAPANRQNHSRTLRR
jgi:hypothetical protein